MKCSEVALVNIEKQRIFFGLEESDIDKFSNFSDGTYKKLSSREVPLLIDTVQDIVEKTFNSKISDFLKPNFKVKNTQSLSDHVKLIVEKNQLNKGNKTIPPYATIIIFSRIKINEHFSNKTIKDYLPDELKNKKIELGSSSLNKNISPIDNTENGTRKPFNQYVYSTAINEKQFERAKAKVDQDWLKKFYDETRNDKNG